MMSNRIRIINGKLVLPAAVITGNVEIENGVITYIGPDFSNQLSGEQIDAAGKYVIPGFIDIHTNGIAGFDLTNGVYDVQSGKFNSDESIYLSGLDQALYQYAKTGITSLLLTSMAAPLDLLKKVFKYVDNYLKTENVHPWRHLLKGLFIEGTFMKLEAFRGAHNQKYFNMPSIELFEELQQASGQNVRIVNVVPEWGTPAFQLIKYLSDKNIICAAGHTGATGYQYEQAIENGLRLAIHFLNGPTGSSSKSFDHGGAVETVLRSDKMSLEIIVDGYHVDKAYVRDIIKRKGYDKVIAITDSMFAAEMPGLTDFEVSGIRGKVGKNGEYLQVADRDNALFGSKLTMDKAFSNLLTWLTSPVKGIWNPEHKILELEEALMKTSQMCSANPAKILGLYDSPTGATGSIEVGKAADIVVADMVRNESGYHLAVEKVLVKGYVTV